MGVMFAFAALSVDICGCCSVCVRSCVLFVLPGVVLVVCWQCNLAPPSNML